MRVGLYRRIKALRQNPAVYFGTDISGTGSLGRRSARAGLVSMATQAVKFLNQLVSTAILARLLTPADFGLVAMGTALVSILKMLTGQALAVGVIQSPSLNGRQLSGFFWMEAALCAALTALATAFAPAAAWFYGEHRVAWVISALSLQILIGGFCACQLALLQRGLQFGLLSGVDLTAGIASKVIAIGAAWLGAGYWALVVMVVSYELIRGLLSWYFTGWNPGRPRWHRESASLLRFGAVLSFESVLSSTAGQLDTILLGKYAGSSSLGHYSRAANLVSLPGRMLVWPLENVCISTLSRSQADPEKMRRLLLHFAEYTALLVLPVLALLAVEGRDVVLFLLGPQWEPAVPLLQWLAVAYALDVLGYPISWLLVATNQLKTMVLWFAGAGAVARVLEILVGLAWGPLGVAVGIATASWVLLPIRLAVSLARGPVTRWSYFKSLLRPVVAASGALGLTWVARGSVIFSRVTGGLPSLVPAAVLMIFFYGLFLVLLPGGMETVRRILDLAVEEAGRRLRKRENVTD